MTSMYEKGMKIMMGFGVGDEFVKPSINEHFHRKNLDMYRDSLRNTYGPRNQAEDLLWLPTQTVAHLLNYWDIQIKKPSPIANRGEEFLNPIREILRQMNNLTWLDPLVHAAFNPSSIEVAPSEIGSKAPDIFNASVPAGKPDAFVFTEDATRQWFKLADTLIDTLDEANTVAETRRRQEIKDDKGPEPEGTNWLKILIVGGIIVGGGFALRQLFITGQEGVSFVKQLRGKK